MAVSPDGHLGHDGPVSEDNNDKKSADASKPESTGDLKRFLNNDPEELPDAGARTPEMGPGGADATENESDVGRGADEENLVNEQPLSAQQSGEDVPDEVQTPEEVDEEGEAMDHDSGAEKETS